jgi:hypothetical protein
MAHLLKVDEGSVHEQGCVERAVRKARAVALSEAAERVEGLDVRYDGEGDKPPDVSVDRAAVLGLLDPS